VAGNRTLKLSILADIDDLNKKLKAANADVETNASGMEKFGKAASAAFVAAAAAAGTFATKLAIDAVKAASDFSETQSKINVIFGESSKELAKFASTAATSLGQTKTQALDAAATFAIFGKSAGLSGQALVSFSTDFVKLASDLASFNNTSPDDAIQALGAALRGESEPLRRYGILLDDATLKAKATEMGIYSGTGALSAQQKVLAAQQVIMAQTSLQQGDFARTSDGLANTQRILAAQFENTKIVLGEKLLPIVLDVIKFFQTNLPTAIKIFQDAFSPIADAIERNKASFQAFGKLIMEYIVPILAVSFVAALNVVGEVAGFIVNIIGKVAGAITTVVNGAISAINVLIKAYNAIPFLPNVSTLPSLTAPKITVPSVSTSTPKVSVPTITPPSATPPATGSGSGSGSSTSGATSATSLSAAQLAAIPTSGSAAGTAGAAILSSIPTPTNTVTVNIGVVGDPESAARTITDIVQQSIARGTGGKLLNPELL